MNKISPLRGSGFLLWNGFYKDIAGTRLLLSVKNSTRVQLGAIAPLPMKLPVCRNWKKHYTPAKLILGLVRGLSTPYCAKSTDDEGECAACYSWGQSYAPWAHLL